MKLDSKHVSPNGIFKVKNGVRLPDDQWVLFSPKDNAFAAVLPAYRDKLIELGASAAQVQAVNALIDRVDQWRAAHPERCKVADIDPGEPLLDGEGRWPS